MKICIANITFLKRDVNGGVVVNVRNHNHNSGHVLFYNMSLCSQLTLVGGSARSLSHSYVGMILYW